MQTIIGIVAGKGGVGKSTITTLLAQSFDQMGIATGIIDADIYGPSIHKMLSMTAAPKVIDDKIIPAYAGSIAFASAGFFRANDVAAAVRAPVANKLIEQLIHSIDWSEQEVIFIDFPPGTGDVQLTLLQQLPLAGAVIVTTPQAIAQIDVEKSIDMCQRMGVPLLGVIENMSYITVGTTRVTPFGSGAAEAIAAKYHIPIFGTLPIDPNICAAMDSGTKYLETEDPLAREIIYTIRGALIDAIDQNCSAKKFEIVWEEQCR